VIYVANAAANRPTKMVNILNQLFAPFVTARAVLK
jgi:polysaccharide export outer membrane protein